MTRDVGIARRDTLVSDAAELMLVVTLTCFRFWTVSTWWGGFPSVVSKKL